MSDLKMKTTENSIFQLTKNGVEFFFCKKFNSVNNNIDLFKGEYEHYSSLKTLHRRNEFLGIRFLRNEYDPSLEISYLESGKPLFKNSLKHVSISHSKNYIGFAAAPYQIGIDIEECHERIIKVRDRFMSDSEKKLFDQNSISELTIAWCVKEALFKLNTNSGIDFKSDLIITDWDKNSMISATMRQDSEWKDVKLYATTFENLVLCFNFE